MPILNKIQNRAIQASATVLQSLKKMDETRVKMLFVFDNERFLSILTIGDIQRAIIRQVELNTPVSNIIDINKQFVTPSETIEQAREQMLRLRAECMPVVDEGGDLVDVYLWNEMFEVSVPEQREKDRKSVV